MHYFRTGLRAADFFFEGTKLTVRSSLPEEEAPKASALLRLLSRDFFAVGLPLTPDRLLFDLTFHFSEYLIER